MMLRLLPGAVALVSAILAWAASAQAITYIAEGRLFLAADTGLASLVNLDAAILTYEVSADDLAEPIFPTRASGTGILGRFPANSIRVTIREQGTGTILFEHSEVPSALSIPLGTTHDSSGPDSFSVGVPLSNLTPGIGPTLFTTLPSISATLPGPYTSFTTYQVSPGDPILQNVARLPSQSELISASLVGISQLRIVSEADSSIFSTYDLIELSLTAIPEPSTAILAGFGLIILSAVSCAGGKKRRTAAATIAIGLLILAASPSSAFDPK